MSHRPAPRRWNNWTVSSRIQHKLNNLSILIHSRGRNDFSSDSRPGKLKMTQTSVKEWAKYTRSKFSRCRDTCGCSGSHTRTNGKNSAQLKCFFPGSGLRRSRRLSLFENLATLVYTSLG
ncbi:hypothetical protein WMY93_032095 [Mugilogobius chulae]|uniref:Uncharacterized protein n=1 Tax=Mugilogobius chulae TaxID=88201 RepID=A0AAW0MCN7_9GOBI